MTDKAIFKVKLDDCCWTLHDLFWEHVYPQDETLSEGPIEVERMNTGKWFVRDGRHRCIRARLAGECEIDATKFVFTP